MPTAGAAVDKDGRRDLATEHVRRHIAVLVGQDVDGAAEAALHEVTDVRHPLVGVEHAAGAEHVLDVGNAHRQRPVQVMAGHVLQQLRQERMAGLSRDKGIVDAGRVSAGRHVGQADNGRRVERHTTGDIEVDVDAARVVQQSIAQDVGALDVLGVAGVVRQDVGVELGDKGRGIDVGPQLVLPVWVQIGAAGDGGLVLGDAGVAQGDLVDDFGHDDGAERRIRRLEIGGRDILRVSIQNIGVVMQQRVECAVRQDNFAQLVDVPAEQDGEPENGNGRQGHDVSGSHRGGRM